MFGFKWADKNSREYLERTAEEMLKDVPQEDLIQEKIDDMSTNELKEFVKKKQDEETEDGW